jgi:hypothetical protein
MSVSLATRASHLTFERFATALFFLAVVLIACVMPAQTDTWWQLRTGEAMWRSGHVMLHDEFTHTVAGGYWPNHEWLAQLLFYAAYRLGGMPMLTASCAAAVTLAWALTATLTPGLPLRRLVLLGAGAILSSPSWSLRPQVFSLALLAITLWITVRRQWLWTLPPLFLIWANLHGAVALGGVLVASAVIATLLAARQHFRATLLVAIACLLCTAATPLGFTLWREVPLSLARLHSYGVQEWQAPGLALTDVPFWTAALAATVLVVINRSQLRTSWTVASLAIASLMFFALAVQSRRNVPPFVLCTVPLIGTLFNRTDPRQRTERVDRPRLNALIFAATVVAGVVGVGMAWYRPLPRLGWTPVSEELRVALANCSGRLYNRYDDGGYLIWFARDKKVFMDSRQDPFPPGIVRDHIQLELSGEYKELFASYDIGCALTVHGSPLAASLGRDRWQAASGHGSWVVFSRPGPEKVAVRAVTPVESE